MDKIKDDAQEHLNSLKEYIKTYSKKKKKKRRTKKDPITIEACLTDYKKNIKKEDATIKLKITARPDDWKKLADYVERDGFGHDMWNYFINPALRECKDKLPRGKHKEQRILNRDIKIDAGSLYAFFSYWCKKPFKEWPEYLKRLIAMSKQEDFEDYFKNRKGQYGVRELTLYCCEQRYYEITQKIGLYPFEDLTNFYQTYIQGSKIPIEVKKKHIKGKTPKEIEQLAYTIPALRNVFVSLEII